MTNDEIVKTLEKWQLEGQFESSGVFVKEFVLYPQAVGFYLSVDISIGEEVVDFKAFGAISECIEQTVEQLKYMRDELIKKLQEQSK